MKRQKQILQNKKGSVSRVTPSITQYYCKLISMTTYTYCMLKGTDCKIIIIKN